MADEAPGTIQGDAIARKRDARRWKELRVLDFKECYFFAAPDRQRQISSQTQPSTQSMMDAPELNTSFAFLLCADFVTEVVNTYMPEAQDWCERKAGEGFEEVFDQIKDDVKKDDKKIFAAIKGSNLYAELPKAFNPDLAIAGAGLWIDRPKAHKPIQVLAVPMREIEINLGPEGEIDDRFIIRWSRNCYVQKLLGEEVWAKVDAETKTKLSAKPSDRSELTWGWWRDWQEDDECWQHVVMIGDRLIHDCKIEGEGSCPFLVMRFNPVADWPWALGPMIQGLPELRQVDEFDRQKCEAAERSTNPAITFPDDSFAAVEQGIEPGMAYPIRPGTEGAVKRMYDQPSMEPEIYATEGKEHTLKKLFYVDHPEQTGDTPPTLGQWLDELARMQRRIGMAGYSFWREGPMKIFIRFKYLLEKAGTIGKLQDKSGRAISTHPYNPTQRAAEQQEIATATQAAQILAQMFPEEWRVWIDGKSSMKNFIDKMRVSGLLAMRDEKQVEKALGRIQGLLGQGGIRQHAGATQAEGAGPPAAI